MNFLAIDTSGKRLTVVVCKGETAIVSIAEDCFRDHSVRLTQKIDDALSCAYLMPADCDFFAAVVGPGSFTGIRIGISTVKGLCFACGKPALSITSFDTLAYSERNGNTLALVDAGRGFYYACGYSAKREIILSPRYCSKEEVFSYIGQGFTPVAEEELFPSCNRVDAAAGLLEAVKAKRDRLSAAQSLSALYLRKSSAEENLR